MISEAKNWVKIDNGIEIANCSYQSPDWEKPRRMVVVCQLIKERPQAAGKTLRLFADDEIYNQYRYGCYVTNMTLQSAEIWRLYRGRVDSENRIKEFKADFGLGSFNLKQFFGTEASLIFAMIGYNLMALFRQFILNSKVQHTLPTLRYKTFAIGAYIEETDGKFVLKMALNSKRRQWFNGLWEHTRAQNQPLTFSIA